MGDIRWGAAMVQVRRGLMTPAMLLAFLCLASARAQAVDCIAMRAACDEQKIKLATCPRTPSLFSCYGIARTQTRTCAEKAGVCLQEEKAWSWTKSANQEERQPPE